MPELVHNTFGAREMCPWCDNTGRYNLTKTVEVKSQISDLTWEEHLLAPCGFCDYGHLIHARDGGPWAGDYRLAEIDVSFNADQLLGLTIPEQEMYAQIERVRAAMQHRESQLQLGPGPGTLEPQGQVAGSPSITLEEEGGEP